ncbi:hypothetical protein M9458_052254 [Cirrhinus mrigala]|uniref:RNase H type-1 domain-containing protein n=1 Tax=Cirrhinus mrigala TaxID=683832 RepID=A0ABD0MU80_CIRMR
MATLRSRLSFARRLPSLSSRGSSSSCKGFTAATARRLGDLQVTVQNVPPGKTLRASAPPRGPVVMPKQTAPPSKSGPSVSFGAPLEEEMSISASEGERSADEADASAEQCPSAVAAPSEADAELSAMLLRAAEGIGLEVPKASPPDPSRLDDWFLGTRSAAPPRSPPVPFFPEVHDELVRAWRAPYSARSRPTSSALATLDAFMPARRRHLAGLSAPPVQSLPASSATLSRTLPSGSRQSRSRLRRSDTSCPSATLPGSPRVPSLSLLVAEGAPLRPPRSKNNRLRLRLRPMMRPSLPDIVAAAGERRRPLFRGPPIPRPADLCGAPDTGNPEMREAALRGTTTSAPPLPEEGRDLLCVQPPSTYGSVVPTHSQKEQFFTSLGQVPRDLFLSDATPPRVRTRSPYSPAREPGKKVGAAQCSQTFLQDVHPSGISPLPLPAGCPTAVTSAPLIPLAARLGAWLELPSPSRRLIQTVRLGYVIQFARRPLKFRGVLFTSVRSDTDASVLRVEIAVLLEKNAIEPVPPAEMKSGFYSPYFIVPKKSGGLRPILDLRVLNRSLLRLPFKMLTSKRILSHRPEGRLLSHLVIVLTQTLSTVCFRGSSVSVQGAPIWPVPVPPHLYEGRGECPEPAMAAGHSHPQLSRRLAHHGSLARSVVRTQGPGASAPQPSRPSGQPREEQTLPSAEDLFSRRGAGLGQYDSLPHQRAHAVSAELSEIIQAQNGGPSQNFSEAPGAYGSCSRGNAARPASYETTSALATRSSPEMGMAPWHTPDWRFPAVSPPIQPVVRPCLPTGRSPLRSGLQACCGLHGCLHHGLGCCMQWASSLGLLDGTSTALAHKLPGVAAVLLALRRFLPMLRRKHVLVHTDNTATVAYINRQGGLRSRRMSQLARHLLLWSQTRLKSLHAVHIPGELNRAADQLSRQPTHPGEWRLHPQTVQLIWSQFGEAQIDLFASLESSHCQLYYSLSEAPLGRDALAHSWPPGPKYAFPPVSLLAQTLCKIREDGEQVLLVVPYWPTRTWFVDLTLLATAPPWKIPLRKDLLSQGMGTIWHPCPDLWNLHVWLLDGTR